ncbi:MAG: trypsin-like peptidase domain-containing protein [Gemmatimonadales bacterium]|nr:trypsin-like peptidase domain-containing protein [Gemmatimonadales bacterium]
MSAPYLKLVDQRTGESHEFEKTPVRIGRDPSSDLVPAGEGAQVVSSNHVRLEGSASGWILVDTNSRNGTFLDDKRCAPDARMPLKAGHVLRLGEAGPRWLVAEVAKRTAPETLMERRLAPDGPKAPTPAAAGAPAPGQPGGRTAVFKSVLAEETKKHEQRTARLLVGAGVLVLAVLGVAWGYTRSLSDRTERDLAAQRAELEAQRRRADSVQKAATAEYARLQQELEKAQTGGAGGAVVDSLTAALAEAARRAQRLETSLASAQASLQEQMKLADQQRGETQKEIERLKTEVAKATSAQGGAAQLDSLTRKLAAAQKQAAQIDAQLKAAKSTDLSAVAKANGPAVGLVTAWFRKKALDGSGFVLTESGVFITNRHVLRDGDAEPDSVTVTLADTRKALPAEVLAVAPASGPDVAVIQILEYQGPRVTRVDWKGTSLRQGEAAAIIGFPAGAQAAFDNSNVARTSMTSGILSKVTSDMVQYDALTVAGSSGSPVFNASGEVIAIHRAKLPEGNVAVPIARLLPLLPAEARQELGQ